MDDEIKSFTFDFTVENATQAQAEALFDVILVVAGAMGLSVGGGAFDVSDDDENGGE